MRHLFFVFLLLSAATAAYSQVPSNDLFANAWILTGNLAVTNGNSNNGTKEPDEPNHANLVGGRSVWFAWTAPSTGRTRIHTIPSQFNTLLAVYTGSSMSTLSLVAFNDNIGGFGQQGQNSRVEFLATAGTTYRIAVDGRSGNGSGPSSGTYTLTVQFLGLVTITSPTNNAVIPYGDPIPINVDASLPNPITRVDFYRFGALFASDDTAPYSTIFSNAPLATNSFFAVAVDNLSQSLTSAVVNVAVLSEGVTIVNPLDGSGYLTTAPISLTAVTRLSSGSITNIEFFVDGLKIGEDSASPYTASWNGVTSGAHQLTALGHADTGLSYQAIPIWITVAERLVSSNSMWKYFDKGIDQGDAWRAPNFDDTGWSNGLAELGYGDDTDGRPEATVVSFGPDSANKYITTYFRRSFVVSNEYFFLIMYMLRDDGAVAYLNGTEAARFNMPAGAIGFSTFAQNAQDEVNFFPAGVSAGLLVPGTNVLAVEMHQTTLNSSDLSFDLELYALPVIPRNRPPLVALTSPTNRAEFLAPAELTLTAEASDSEGPVDQVEFFANGILVGRDFVEPFSITWTNPPIGWHRLVAVATDSEGASAPSSAITISIYNQTGAPLVEITSPPDGRVVEGPTNVLLTAQASAPAGITNLEFYAGDTLIGSSAGTELQRADYQFQNSLASTVAGSPALANLGPNAFTTATVDGSLRSVLRFVQNDGLALNPASGVFSNSYTLAALFSFEALSNWRRIFDFKNGTSDNGVYYVNGTLQFYQFTPGGPVTIGSNTFMQVVVTRDGSSGNVVGYVDGVQQFSFIDAANNGVPDTNDTLHLFRDDGSEGSPGMIARFRIFDKALTASEVAGLDRLPSAVTGIGTYSFLWNDPPFGTNVFTAVAYDAAGNSSTSAPVTLVINEPPLNTNAPVIVAVDPAPGSTVTNFTSITVTFSERVVNVGALDFLINGRPVNSVEGTGSNYTFRFAQPGGGALAISWANNHGIEDIGYPAALPFDGNGPGATWSYQVVDRAPPTIVSRNPVPGAVVTNLTQIQVGFSEAVAGVDAADLLINGSPALNLLGEDASYTFEFPRPAGGLVNITWAGNHGITDTAIPANPFSAVTWSYTLDLRTILVRSNSMWRFVKGTAEASNPLEAWRFPEYDDSGWSNALAPFYYGDPYNSVQNPGTFLGDMQGVYSSIYLRSRFFIADVTVVTNLFLRAQCDDGFIVWINGSEALRFNMPPGVIPFSGVASSAINEPQNNGAPYQDFMIPDPGDYLIPGTNVLTIHAFNQSLGGSSDFGFNAELYAFMADLGAVPPRIQGVTPTPGEIFSLTNITVRFTEGVANVTADDLLINGVAATNVASTTNTTYVFSFPQPAYGTVSITWSNGHGIVDFDAPPKPFTGATFQYTLLNPAAPVVASQSPLARATLTTLTQVTVTFNKAVTGVEAGELLVNSVPATNVTGSGNTYTFSFPQPGYGLVTIGWASDATIEDLAVPPNAFDPQRRNNTWTYTLVDQTPPRIVSQDPPAGALVTNLTQIIVVFSESVSGINASDLLVSGVPATGLTGTNGIYTFSFPQPNTTVVNITWANLHGIRDLATVPNSFDASGPGATWTYSTPDNLAPSVAVLDPPAFVTVRSLARIRVTFSEPVSGVSSNDLLINSVPARSVSGSGAGPYTFAFLPPANGSVEIRWAANHGIFDLANTPNAFAGGEWTYTLDPDASFAGKIVINEIMFNPLSGLPAHEWLELHNISTNLINLAGWQFTRGVQYTFPNVSIPAGGYLAVAASPVAFQTNHPGVANYVGGWTGRLANSDETIELSTALGEVVDSVHYATEGDWARRERGRGADVVESIVRNGNIATVTIFAHGYSGPDQIVISGADQPEYNGQFTLNNIGLTSFNITISGTPASPATGNIISRRVLDDGGSGWSWFCAADGFGYSFELANPALPNTSGQNWLSSANVNGTPGRANSVLTNNLAPLLNEVTHFPSVPSSTDPVAITTRVDDESGLQSFALFYRNHTSRPPGAFISTNMVDDGAHGDGLASDGLYGALLPALPHGSIVEFYVQATDTSGLSRTWPAPARELGDVPGQFANALYQVANEVITNTLPIMRVVMTDTERAIFPPADRDSDAEMNATLISTDGEGTKVRYLCGVRIRGAGSRTRQIPNNRLNIPNDNRWNGMVAVNLNSQFVHAQMMGSAVAQKSGLPASDAHLIRYYINGVNAAPVTAPNNGSGQGAGYSTFILVEPVNGDLAADLFPEDGDGNVYRASTGQHNADLTYQGTTPANYLARGYMKTSNGTENDWTDLMALTFAFNQVASDADYFQAMSTNVNVQTWLRYFAIGTLINFGETSLFNGRGDDYAMYRGVVDRRFVPIGHDFDTVFGQGDTIGSYATSTGSSIFIMLNPPNTGGQAPNMLVLRRFLTNAVFAPLFFAEIKRLCDTVFHPSELDPLFDQMLSGWGPTTLTINAMKTHAANRRTTVLSQIPLALTINHSLVSSNGVLYTTSPTVSLNGTSHAIDTRKVLVNGAMAGWSPWEGRWTYTSPLQPGINRVLFQSMDSNDVEFARATLDIWYNDGSLQSVAGNISSDTVWTAADGPYQVTADITVNAGVTLTIQGGTTVYLAAGADITIANGGRLLAEGADTARIRFAALPGGGAWGGITINGGASSPEARITYAHIEGNGSTAIRSLDGTVFLDHLSFGTLTERYIDVDRSSFVISHCVFPTPTAALEMVHGNGGIKAGGRGIFSHNFFGAPNGYSDTIDFTGGNRPQPIVHFINNVFMGSGDDILDLDSTDAWVEGNIFMHVHRNGSPDSASAISGGNDTGQASEITIIGNLFYDVDHAALAKQGNFYTLINNTIVRQTRVGGVDTDAAVVVLADEGTTEGAGFHMEGNIIYDAEKLVRDQTSAAVTFTNNLMPLAWDGPGGNNSTDNPLLKHIPQLSETIGFTSWEQAQVLWDWFSLRTGSPASGTGPNGLDKGGVVPMGASISGTTTLQVGVNRAALGFPSGSGYTHYQWRLDGGPWSAETPIATPISLPALANGPHIVDVSGKRDSGLYQDSITSRAWTVDSTTHALRLNEILAATSGAPDAIELFNSGSSNLDLEGMRLTDDPSDPDKFIFPAGAQMGAYLVVYSSTLGFALNQAGDSLYLYDAAENGGALIDSISFGPQLENFSIGRLADGAWALTRRTFGGPNEAAAVGDPTRLRINEWLALGSSDFVELYNPDSLPVALGGLYVSDEIIGWPDRHQIAPLSFIPAFGYLPLDISLSGDQGNIGLFLPDLTAIDCVAYQPQRPNISQGRSPNGGTRIVFFDQPTPGAPNPLVTGPGPFGGLLVINEVLALNAGLTEGGRTPDWVEIYNGSTNLVNLADLSLSDDTLEPRRFVFRAGVTLDPGAYLRVLCDPNSTNSGPLINTNFALGSMGGGIYLFDNQTNGGSLLSAVVYGIQTADLSIGRVPDGNTNWFLTMPTPNAANSPVPAMGDVANLKVNEWLADPLPGDDDWFEIYNPDSLPVAIGGLHLTDDLNNRTKHVIAALSFIGSGTNAWQRFIAANGAGADHVGFSLRAAREDVGISTTNGNLINGISFTNQQSGISEGRFPDGAAGTVSFPGTASPGARNWRWLSEIVINEVLTHTDEPLEDAIELRNLTGEAIDISGWWLSDDNGTLLKYQIPFPTIVPANGFAVIYENQFTNREIAAIPFALSSGGDEVVLSAAANNALTGYRTAVDFGAAPNAVSFGRYVTSDNREEFVAMVEHTFGVTDPGNVIEFRTGRGTNNTYPRVGPIVIGEIMYHPPDLGIEDNVRDEYIELRNLAEVPVQISDWRLRDAVDFDFPSNTTIAAESTLLIVSFDPINNAAALAAFRAAYNVDPSQPIVGPYDGKLANDTDDIELRRPDEVSYYLVERVRYFDGAPWPNTADGTGLSIHRVSDTGFANDPTNFVAGAPTPGLQAGTADFDGDGMPDSWENTYGLDRQNPTDAHLDNDADGLSNLEEYQAGTHPLDDQSVLRLQIAVNGGETILGFVAESNKSYSLLWKESVDAGAWAKLADIAATPSQRTITTIDPLPFGTTRIYQVVTPEAAGELNEAPAILESPKSILANWDGQATFTVSAHTFNPDLFYEWTHNGAPVPGGDGPTLTLSNLRYNNIGAYAVTVTDAIGSVATAPAYLSMPPRILVQPESKTARAGESVTFSVTAEGAGPLSYLWLRNRRPLIGQTSPTLTLDNIGPADATNYSVMVFHQLPWGKVSVASSNVTLTLDTSRLIQKVVHVSLDGLASVHLRNYVSNAPAQFPNFVRLMNEGAYTFNARCDYDASETIPNHACMFTGRPVLQPAGGANTIHHGYNNNFPGASDTFHASGNPNVPYKSSFFDVAHDHGLTTAFYAGKNRLGICDRSYNAANGALDLILPDHGRDKIDVTTIGDISGNAITNEVNALIADLTGPAPKQYSFIHLAEPDITGHASGWGSVNWSNAVRLVDQQLGRIFSVIGNRTAFIVTADHGGGGVIATGHSEPYHIANYTIPFFLWGPGIPAGVDIYTMFSNRADPGTNRTDYSVNPQPVRNADGGNLALTLLGLPPIPGSYFQPALSGAASVPASLFITIQSVPGNGIMLTFTVPAHQSCTLLFSETLSGSDWSAIATYPVQPTERVEQRVAPTPTASGFYRLHTP